MRDVPIPSHITILFVEQEVCINLPIVHNHLLTFLQIVGDETTALESVLQADVWRDILLREEASLNAKLTELEAENDEKRFDDARDEAQTRLAEVHARLAEMEAESGPARAAALLAGECLIENLSLSRLICSLTLGLGFSEADQSRPTKSFSGGWRMRLALARALFVKVPLFLPISHTTMYSFLGR